MEKVSLIMTVRNEAVTLPRLLQSIEAQTRLPDEVVIVDGGSTDNTLTVLQTWIPSFPVLLLEKRGNRSIGRNEAIAHAKHTIIAITDAGCTLHPEWLAELVTRFAKGVDVVAGYYRSDANSVFEKAAAAYMLVMPDHVDATTFLPATRSMAVKKSMWEKVGRFDERYSHNEDYVFAHALRNAGAKIIFASKAIVVWQPPANWPSFTKQAFRFAIGDAEAGILRPKVIMVYARYAFVCLIAYYSPFLAALLLLTYVVWSVKKNYRYVNNIEAVNLLPAMQLTTDFTVMIGTAIGLIKRGMYALTH